MIRLDILIATKFGVSRRLARQLCRDGKVLLNAKPATAGTMVRDTDEVFCEPPQRLVPRPELVADLTCSGESVPSGLPQVVFEDDHLIVLEKPSNIHSVLQSPSDPVTVSDYLAYYFPEIFIATGNVLEAGMIQRLDFETSGLLLVAKTASAFELLKNQMRLNRIHKSYLAYVEGRVSPGRFVVETYLYVPQNKKRVYWDSPHLKGKPERRRTTVECLKFDPAMNASLVKAEGSAMCRHQVRAHLASTGHPLCADEIYGAKPWKHSRHFLLHAEGLRFEHPLSAEPMEINSSPTWLSLAEKGTDKL